MYNHFNTRSGLTFARAPFWFAAGLALCAAPATTFAQNCNLLVPANPLTASGLSTPYVLSPATAADSCDETGSASAAFVQAVVYDSSKALCGNNMCIYNPLVVNAADPTPAVTPVPLPHPIPATATVALWFGFDGGNLTLTDSNAGATLAAANCVPNVAKGVVPTTLGQFGYCNAVNFFKAANSDINAGNLAVPPVGIGTDGQLCPTVRSFGVVDQDQSDNQTTWYVIVPASGATPARVAQYNTANASINGAALQQNPSDEWLASQHMDTALGCTPWMVPDMTNSNKLWPSMATNELQAAAYQAPPIALVPLGDPFTTNPPQSMNGNLANVNLYRAGVDQPPAPNNAAASTAPYCTYLTTLGVQRLQLDQAIFTAAASPVPSVANSLFTFLASRLVASLGLLNCTTPNPINLVTNQAGVVTAATFNPQISVAPGMCAPVPVTLASPAGPGDAFVTLTSSNSTIATFSPNLNPIQVTITAGNTTPQRGQIPQICGVGFGFATVTASGATLSSGTTTTVYSTASLSFPTPSVTISAARPGRLTLNLSAPLPTALTVNLISDTPSVATVPATVTIPANSTTATVVVTGVAQGTAVIHASSLPNVPDTFVSVTVGP